VAGLRGLAAQRAVRAMLEAVGPLLPPDVILEVVGGPRVWTLRPQGSDATGHGVWQITQRSNQPFPHVEADLSFGIGTWIPGLPKRLNAKLSATDALEMIQDKVTEMAGTPWPGPGYEVKVNVTSETVHPAFESRTGGKPIVLPPLDLALFQ
jgi:hypothetical protein